MRRSYVLVPLLLATPFALIGWRLRAEAAAQHADAGGSGTVEGVEVALASKIPARVLSVGAREGQAVESGQILVILDCREPEAALAEAQARLEAAEARAEGARARAQGAAQGAAGARASSGAAQAQAQALRAQEELARRQATRLKAQDRDLAASNIDQSETSALALGHQADAAAQSAKASLAQVQVVGQEAKAAEANATSVDHEVEAGRAALSRAVLATEECVIRAPRGGIVETLPWEPGELVPAGATVAVLVDLTVVRATFYLPNADLGAARPDALAVVTADAWPGLSFTGKVSTVSAEAAFTPRNIQTRTDRDRLVYAVEVLVPNPGAKLRPGMPVDVLLPGTGR
jgi:HlyD family secretion protein